MKKFVEIAWNKPIDTDLFYHLRNDFRFHEDHLAVFDSVTEHSGTVEFHCDNTGLEQKKFTRVYNQVAETVLNELIRLAEIGFESEQKIKENFTENKRIINN